MGKERKVRMRVKMKTKYAGSCGVMAGMLVFLSAAFLPVFSYADNISPEMNRLTPVISVSQNQENSGPDIKPGTPDALQNQSPFDTNKDEQYQEEHMKLLKPVDELLPPMDPEYGKMLFWADKMEQVAAEAGDNQGEERNAENKPASLELLARLDDAREAMESDTEPRMNSEWIQAGEEDLPVVQEEESNVIESGDRVEFEPTQVPLVLGGGAFTVDYASSEQEDLMVKAIQDLAAENVSGRDDKEAETEKTVRQAGAAPLASVLEASGLRSENQKNADQEKQTDNVPDAQVFAAFALPAPIDLGSQIARQVEKMFFSPAETVDQPADVLSEPAVPVIDNSARMTEVLDTMTLAPPVPAENGADPALLAGEMGLLAPIPGAERMEANAGERKSELKQVMESELSVSAPEKIAEAIDLIAPPEMFEPKAGGKVVGDLLPADLDEASKKMDESEAVSMAFPDVALKMAVNSHQQRSLTSAPDTVGVFHKIVNEAMKPLVAAMAPGVSKMVNEVSRAYSPSSFSFFFDEAPSRPTNFLEERFSFVSYVLPSVSYYRSSSGYSSNSYGSNSDGSKKKRRYRYYF